jgi:antitoxin component of RelBE/YafQ-DinJ toxin-antitoxin module
MAIRTRQVRVAISAGEEAVLCRIQEEHGLTRSEAVRFLIHQVAKPTDVPTYRMVLPVGPQRKPRADRKRAVV